MARSSCIMYTLGLVIHQWREMGLVWHGCTFCKPEPFLAQIRQCSTMFLAWGLQQLLRHGMELSSPLVVRAMSWVRGSVLYYDAAVCDSCHHTATGACKMGRGACKMQMFALPNVRLDLWQALCCSCACGCPHSTDMHCRDSASWFRICFGGQLVGHQ